MTFRPNQWLVLLPALLLVLGTDSGAQTRPDTGRHPPKPVPAPEKVEKDPAQTDLGPVDRSWTFSGSIGILGAGRVFQVETVDNVSVPWDLGGGASFQASRFNATFDQNVSFGLQAGKGMGRYWGLAGSLGYSRMNLGAEILAGQQGTVVLLDRVDVFTVGLGGKVKFLQAPSYPFFTAEGLLTSLGAGIIQEIDQTSFGWRVGLGYRQVLSPHWAGKVQARLSRTGFSLDGYMPSSPLLEPSAIEFESEDHLTFFEIMLSLEFL